MKLLNSILLVCLFSAMAVSAIGQKIGYVNVQLVMAEMPEVKEANSNLETYNAQLSKRAEQMYQSLQTKAVALQQKSDNGEISPKQFEIERASLAQEEQKLVEFQSKSQNDIAVKQNELLNPILKKVQDAIDAIAAEESYTYVFDSSQGMILYADETADVTQKVKVKLGM